MSDEDDIQLVDDEDLRAAAKYDARRTSNRESREIEIDDGVDDEEEEKEKVNEVNVEAEEEEMMTGEAEEQVMKEEEEEKRTTEAYKPKASESVKRLSYKEILLKNTEGNPAEFNASTKRIMGIQVLPAFDPSKVMLKRTETKHRVSKSRPTIEVASSSKPKIGPKKAPLPPPPLSNDPIGPRNIPKPPVPVPEEENIPKVTSLRSSFDIVDFEVEEVPARRRVAIDWTEAKREKELERQSSTSPIPIPSWASIATASAGRPPSNSTIEPKKSSPAKKTVNFNQTVSISPLRSPGTGIMLPRTIRTKSPEPIRNASRSIPIPSQVPKESLDFQRDSSNSVSSLNSSYSKGGKVSISTIPDPTQREALREAAKKALMLKKSPT